MQKALVSLLVLGWTWTLQGIPVLYEPLFPTKENFNLSRFLGTWHDVAVASTCPHMRQHRRDAAIGKLDLKRGSTADNIEATRTVLRHGTCKKMSGDYELTSTPGRFIYHIKRWAADVDAYVVHANYREYAIVIMVKRNSTKVGTSIKLYSRTKSVRDTILEDFKTLVKEQGMSEDSIIVKQDKGDCVPEEVVDESTPQPQPQLFPFPRRGRRDVEDEGGSGDMADFNSKVDCESVQDSGPCFGLLHRYYYNSSTMACQLFKYGGCMGNNNNFETEKACLQTCRTEAACRLPMEVQPCTDQPQMWVFNSVRGVCEPAGPNSCPTNANKFYSKAECEEYCGVIKAAGGDFVPGKVVDESTPQPQPQPFPFPRRGRRDTVAPLEDEGGSGDMADFNSKVDCNSVPDIGPCLGLLHRYYYNSSTMACQLFNYGGCMGNKNNFETEKACLQTCRTEAACRLPMEDQPCTGQPQMWVFNSVRGVCEPAGPNSCPTNANKFYSKAECEEYCGVIKAAGGQEQ